MLKPTLFIFAFRRRLRPRASDTAGDGGGDGEEGLFGGDETRSFTVDMILRTSCRILIRERRKIRQESDPQKISRSHLGKHCDEQRSCVCQRQCTFRCLCYRIKVIQHVIWIRMFPLDALMGSTLHLPDFHGAGTFRANTKRLHCK